MKREILLAEAIFSAEAEVQNPISRQKVENDKERGCVGCNSLHNYVDINIRALLTKNIENANSA